MRRAQHSLWTLAAAFACLGLVAGAATAAPRQVATLSGGAAGVEFRPVIEYEKLVLTVSGPGEMSFRQEFAQGQAATFSAFGKGGQTLPNGNYTYELLAVPRFSPEVRQRLAAARGQGNERAVLAELRQAGLLPKGTMQSGGFVMENGTFIVAGLAEETGPKAAKEAVRAVTAADQVIPDDLIVQQSLCVGFDCVNNENFGFDTIRLKENNLRIHFDDTSTQAGFPANDWRLIANDSASGGSSKFSIEDSTSAKTPFTITAGAATNSIFADSTGRIGFRTSTPVLDLHVATSNTPAIRLEQNNSGGFTAQTWDIGANEANFFVRDVTGGSKLSLRIRPGAPTSSLDISADGDVGIGTASPSNKLHVLSSGSGAFDGKVLVQNTSGTAIVREMLELSNSGGAMLIFSNPAQVGTRWTQLQSGTSFLWDDQADAPVEMSLTNGSTLTVVDVIETSDRAMKTDIVAVQPEDILAKLSRLPLATWRFKHDENKATHLGPMAQDFSAIFGLGYDDKHIKALDVAGVSLAAVQALNHQVSAKDAEISELKSRIETLEKMVQGLAQQATAEQR
jgi:Chaperone of endosialidase